MITVQAPCLFFSKPCAHAYSRQQYKSLSTRQPLFRHLKVHRSYHICDTVYYARYEHSVTATPKVAPCDIAEWNVLLNGNEGDNNFVVFHFTSVICST